MAGCKVTDGFSNSCSDRMKVSGLGKKFWIGYIQDLDTPISLDQTADIGTLDFGSYGGLYPFEGSKFAHDYTWEESVASGGNIGFTHTLNVKLTPGSTAEDVILQSLLQGDDIFAVVEDLNRQFWILGAGYGLTSTAASGGSGGKEAGGDTATSITLSGVEKTVPLRFSTNAGYNNTLAYLEGLEL